VVEGGNDADLRLISMDLYNLSQKLSQKIQKIEAMRDIQECHEDKHSRLFYPLIAEKAAYKENQQQVNTNDTEIGTKGGYLTHNSENHTDLNNF
jgi:hypothetical protein